MDAILPYLINAILGAAGGWIASMLKKNGLGMIGNLLSGAIGGNVLPIITSALGMFAATGDGNLDVASIITALVGGGAGSLLGGLLKKPATA